MDTFNEAEQGQVTESMQMGETRRALISALSEPDEVYDIPENKFLKEKWISEAVKRLNEPITGDSASIPSYTDANLTNQNERGFAAMYLKHLGSEVKVEELKDIVGGDRKLPIIKREELDFPKEQRIAWVEDAFGRKNLISTTKIDGVQVELSMNAIGSGPETTGVLSPILLLSGK